MTNLDTILEVKNDIKDAIERQFVTPDGGMVTYADAIRKIQIIGPLEGDFTGLKFMGSRMTYLPMIDTSKYTDMSGMFYNCFYLKIIPKLECGNVNNINDMLFEVNNSTTGDDDTLYLGGFKDLGKQKEFVDGYVLDLTTIGVYNPITSYRLKRESYLNVFNDIWDRSNTVYPTITIKVDQADISRVGISDEDIAIATNKGWTIEVI